MYIYLVLKVWGHKHALFHRGANENVTPNKQIREVNMYTSFKLQKSLDEILIWL